MSKKTLGLIVILLILTVVLVFVALSTKQSSQPAPTTTSQAPSPTPTLVPGRTSLSLSPDPIQVSPSGSATVNVMIDTGGDQVRSVQLEIAYDPKAVTNVSLKPGTFFTNPNVLPVGGVNQATGRITYAIVPGSFSETKVGTGVVATLTFTPILSAANPSTTISLLDKSLVSGQARGQNVLIKTTGTKVMLGQTTQPAVKTLTTPVTTTP